MTIRIGILSDTHLYQPSGVFCQQVEECFRDTSIILHAGDLTDLSVLKAFQGWQYHAVHGNMCHGHARETLPAKKVVEVGGFRIGLTHGMGARINVEDHLIDQFDEVDCIVSGHTHRPHCHWMYDVLFVNPGSFVGTGPYGSAGTYAILEVGQTLSASIHQVGQVSG